jgi:hypothetical protein
MAKKNRNDKVMMIPEGETRDKFSYCFFHKKSTAMLREGKKLRMRKYHPGKETHVWFVETRMPPHS